MIIPRLGVKHQLTYLLHHTEYTSVNTKREQYVRFCNPLFALFLNTAGSSTSVHLLYKFAFTDLAYVAA